VTSTPIRPRHRSASTRQHDAGTSMRIASLATLVAATLLLTPAADAAQPRPGQLPTGAIPPKRSPPGP
jgi:hypothetical protein